MRKRLSWGRKSPTSRFRVFGSPLSTVLAEEGGTVPNVVTDCIAYISHNGIDMEGIFRLCGSANELNSLVEMYDKRTSPNLDQVRDPFVVAQLLKKYFRDLPEPLLTFELFESFIGVSSIEHEPERISRVRDLVTQLPGENRVLLATLIAFLVRVAAHEASNKMPARNLAIVFGPNLLSSSNLDEMLLHTGRVSQLIALMIDHFEDVFAPILDAASDVLSDDAATSHEPLAAAAAATATGAASPAATHRQTPGTRVRGSHSRHVSGSNGSSSNGSSSSNHVQQGGVDTSPVAPALHAEAVRQGVSSPVRATRKRKGRGAAAAAAAAQSEGSPAQDAAGDEDLVLADVDALDGSSSSRRILRDDDARSEGALTAGSNRSGYSHVSSGAGSVSASGVRDAVAASLSAFAGEEMFVTQSLQVLPTASQAAWQAQVQDQDALLAAAFGPLTPDQLTDQRSVDAAAGVSSTGQPRAPSAAAVAGGLPPSSPDVIVTEVEPLSPRTRAARLEALQSSGPLFTSLTPSSASKRAGQAAFAAGDTLHVSTSSVPQHDPGTHSDAAVDAADDDELAAGLSSVQLESPRRRPRSQPLRVLRQQYRSLQADVVAFDTQWRATHGSKPRDRDREPIRGTVDQAVAIRRLMRHVAASRIQALVRGHLARRRVAELRTLRVSARSPRFAAAAATAAALASSASLSMLPEASVASFAQLSLTTSTAVASVAASPNDASVSAQLFLQSTLDKLESERSAAHRPSHVVSMTSHELASEKTMLKHELRAYDKAFAAQHNREPTKHDKEPLRPLYQRYKELKARLDHVEANAAAGDEASASHHAAGTNGGTVVAGGGGRAQEDARAPRSVSAPVSAAASPAATPLEYTPVMTRKQDAPRQTRVRDDHHHHKQQQQQQQQHQHQQQHFDQKQQQHGSTAGTATAASPAMAAVTAAAEAAAAGSAASVERELSEAAVTPALPHASVQSATAATSAALSGSTTSLPPALANDPEYRTLKAEKRVLQAMLHQYQEEFVKKNGRKVKYAADKMPIKKEYLRYKALKTELAKLERAYGVDTSATQSTPHLPS